MVRAQNPILPNNTGRGRLFWRLLWRQRQLAVMSVPMLLYILLFNYAPLWGWITAFMDYKPSKPLFDNAWVGLANFSWLFSQREFYLALRNTLAMSAINLVFGTASSVILALFLNEIRAIPFKRAVQTVTYLPHFLSWVIVVGLAQSMFATDGAVNQALIALRIRSTPAFWLGEGRYFWWLVGVINVWKEVGWNSIIYLAAIAAIDPTLYEAASIDGAGRFRKMLSVTMPGIRATFFVLLIMNIGHLMEAGFEIQYLMGQNLLVDWSQTIDIYVLKYGITQGRYARATAAGMFKSVVSIVLLLGANALARRFDESTLM